MAERIHAGRFTAQVDGPFVVFLIGMRVNHIARVREWVPTATAMATMLRTLYREPEHGFLGAQTFLYWRGIGLVQYWRSFGDLERFARDPGQAHLPAWRRFNRAVGGSGTVGIWHETYLVQEGQYEAVYGNMPPFGLATVGEHVPVSGRRETAAGRLGRDPGPGETGRSGAAVTGA